MPEGEEEEQGMKNLFENIMKENFLNLVKETDFQEVQEAQRLPKKLDPRRNTPGYIIITLAKIKNKERILGAARERNNYLQRGTHKTCQLISQKRPCRQEGAGKNIQSH